MWKVFAVSNCVRHRNGTCRALCMYCDLQYELVTHTQKEKEELPESVAVFDTIYVEKI